MVVHMVIDEFMRSRKWKGVKVWQGIAANSKIPSPAKFFNQKNFTAGGAKVEPEKFGHLATHKKIGWTKEKGKAPRCSKHKFATNAIWRQDSKV
jgi:hypothetical protein